MHRGVAPPTPDPEADPEAVARAIALRLLDRQPRTRAELAKALAARAVPAAAAAAVLDRFTEVGLIDDEAFAQAWVGSRHRGRGLARRALAEELRRRGVDHELARGALATVSTDDEVAAATALVTRRLHSMTGLAVEVKRRRLLAMLARRGFSGSLAQRVVAAALADEPEPASR